MELPLVGLGRSAQLSERVYEVLCDAIVNVRLKPGTPLRVNAIATQLGISTTPARDALNHLEKDGLVSKEPYQAWVVREFSDREVRDLYELRVGLECFGVRLACRRIGKKQIDWLKKHQEEGEKALGHNDIEAYQIYNQELHGAILKATENLQLQKVMDALSLQFQMLMAQTIRFRGRPTRGLREHARLIGAISKRDEEKAQKFMEEHLNGALKDILEARRTVRPINNIADD